MMVLSRVRVENSFRMPPPPFSLLPMSFGARPLVMVTLVMDTTGPPNWKTPRTWKTRSAPWPLMMVLSWPAPMIVRLPVTSRSPRAAPSSLIADAGQCVRSGRQVNCVCPGEGVRLHDGRPQRRVSVGVPSEAVPGVDVDGVQDRIHVEDDRHRAVFQRPQERPRLPGPAGGCTRPAGGQRRLALGVTSGLQIRAGEEGTNPGGQHVNLPFR